MPPGVAYVDALPVVPAYPVGHFFLGVQAMYLALGRDEIMVAGVAPAQILVPVAQNGRYIKFLLGGSAVHYQVFYLPHGCRLCSRLMYGGGYWPLVQWGAAECEVVQKILYFVTRLQKSYLMS